MKQTETTQFNTSAQEGKQGSKQADIPFSQHTPQCSVQPSFYTTALLEHNKYIQIQWLEKEDENKTMLTL